MRDSRQDDWRDNAVKVKKVRIAIKAVLARRGIDDSARADDQILELVKNQNEY